MGRFRPRQTKGKNARAAARDSLGPREYQRKLDKAHDPGRPRSGCAVTALVIGVSLAGAVASWRGVT